MKEAVIVSAARTAVGKAGKGTLRNTRPDDLAAVVIQELLRRTQLTVAQIAVRVGIADPSNLGKVFRKLENMAPKTISAPGHGSG